MKTPAQSYSPTPDEFFQTVSVEYEFLVSQYGFKRTIPEGTQFTVEYHRPPICIQITGINWGFGAQLLVVIAGESLPIWPILINFDVPKTPQTNKPQLDQIREYAWRLRNECPGIIIGDVVQIESLRVAMNNVVRAHQELAESNRLADNEKRFFDLADSLFREKKFAECVAYLQTSPYKFSQFWDARFEYAKKQA